MQPSPQEHFSLKEHMDGVVFVFPGQGSQYVNMGRELYEQESVFRQAFDDCAELLIPLMKEDIRNIIFPAQIQNEAEHPIRHTYYTQPALFTIEYALAKLWMSWGIRPAAFIGHSIGEFVAAHLAGVFSLQDGLLLISSRGRLMAEFPSGSMLSVRSGEEKIKPYYRLNFPWQPSTDLCNQSYRVLKDPFGTFQNCLRKKELPISFCKPVTRFILP